jgi:hypothetical protein
LRRGGPPGVDDGVLQRVRGEARDHRREGFAREVGGVRHAQDRKRGAAVVHVVRMQTKEAVGGRVIARNGVPRRGQPPADRLHQGLARETCRRVGRVEGHRRVGEAAGGREPRRGVERRLDTRDGEPIDVERPAPDAWAATGARVGVGVHGGHAHGHRRIEARNRRRRHAMSIRAARRIR